MKGKKLVIIIISIIAIIITVIAVLYFQNKKSEETAKSVLTDFVELIKEKNYDEMYNKVSNINMSKEDFISRNKNIYEGIECENIKIEITNIEKQENNYQIEYNETMFTRCRRSSI